MSMDALEGLCLGLGDELRVYKANAIIPQIAANITRSGTCVSLARMLASRDSSKRRERTSGCRDVLIIKQKEAHMDAKK